MSSLKEKILAINDGKREKVEVPEWKEFLNGDAMYIRAMNGLERDQYEQSILDQRGEDTKLNLINARAKLVVICLEDESGARVFDDADVSALSMKSGKALNRLSSVAQRLSGLRKQDIEELAGNSGSGQNGASL